jgi:hypothetical protein
MMRSDMACIVAIMYTLIHSSTLIVAYLQLLIATCCVVSHLKFDQHALLLMRVLESVSEQTQYMYTECCTTACIYYLQRRGSAYDCRRGGKMNLKKFKTYMMMHYGQQVCTAKDNLILYSMCIPLQWWRSEQCNLTCVMAFTDAPTRSVHGD